MHAAAPEEAKGSLRRDSTMVERSQARGSAEERALAVETSKAGSWRVDARGRGSGPRRSDRVGAFCAVGERISEGWGGVSEWHPLWQVPLPRLDAGAVEQGSVMAHV